MKCPECGKINPANATMCNRCGALLTSNATVSAGRRETKVDPSTTTSGHGNSSEARRTMPVGGGAGQDWNSSAPQQVPPQPAGASSSRRKTMLEGAAPVSPHVPPHSEPSVAPGPSPSLKSPSRQRSRTIIDEGFVTNPQNAQSTPRAPARRIVGWMVSFDFNNTGQDYQVRAGKNQIGRDRDCDISLFFDGEVSGNHADIIWRSGQCAVKDNGSSGGTFVNGEDIGIGGVHPLKSGDALRVGKSTFKLYLLDETERLTLWPPKE